MTEEHVSFLSFVMGFDEFGVLYFFELLYLWFDDGGGSIGVDGFGLYMSFYFIFSFLVDIDF